jgi:2-dehydropantoate 2-reductase
VPDILINKWEKLTCNVFWNITSVITRQNMGPKFLDFTKPEAVDFTRQLMHEVISVGRARGVDLEDGEAVLDRHVQFTRDMGDFKPSMLIDFENGVPLELDVIVGSVMKWAQELKLEVPTLRAVYVLVCAISGQVPGN